MSSRSLKLYIGASCPYCQRVQIAAHEQHVPIESVVVGLMESMPAWYKEMNPRETVPTLEVNKGATKRFVYESRLIEQYIDKLGQNPGALYGSNPVQRHRIDFFLSQMGELTGACYALLGEPMSEEKRAALEASVAYIEGILADNQTTGPFYCDATFTMADAALAPFIVRLKPALKYFTGFDLLSKAPRMGALFGAACQRASVRETSPTAEMSVQTYSRFVPDDMPMSPAKGGHVLYMTKFSPYSNCVRLACALRGFKPYLVDVPLFPAPKWFTHMNSRETVPVLYTPGGDAVHEARLIVNYIDSITAEGASLMPRSDADQEYEVSFFVDNAYACTQSIINMMYRDKKAVEDVLWGFGELEKHIAKHPFGEGPFFGGKTMNAGDVAIMPFLVMIKAFTPELTGGANLLKDFPLLDGLVEAGIVSEAGKQVFEPLPVYLHVFRGLLAKMGAK